MSIELKSKVDFSKLTEPGLYRIGEARVGQCHKWQLAVSVADGKAAFHILIARTVGKLTASDMRVRTAIWSTRPEAGDPELEIKKIGATPISTDLKAFGDILASSDVAEGRAVTVCAMVTPVEAPAAEAKAAKA